MMAAIKKELTLSGELLSVSTKWLCHFVEFTFFTVSKADGREKCKEWFQLWPKPTRTTGIAGRYEFSRRGCSPSDTSS